MRIGSSVSDPFAAHADSVLPYADHIRVEYQRSVTVNAELGGGDWVCCNRGVHIDNAHQWAIKQCPESATYSLVAPGPTSTPCSTTLLTASPTTMAFRLKSPRVVQGFPGSDLLHLLQGARFQRRQLRFVSADQNDNNQRADYSLSDLSINSG